MNIIDKIKAVSNLIVLRSKYDKVCDELAYRELEANKSNDLIETIEPMLKESLDKVENLSFNNHNLKREIESLEKEKDDNYDMFIYKKDELKKQKYFRWLWLLAGFSGGVLAWAGIIKYLSL